MLHAAILLHKPQWTHVHGVVNLATSLDAKPVVSYALFMLLQVKAENNSPSKIVSTAALHLWYTALHVLNVGFSMWARPVNSLVRDWEGIDITLNTISQLRPHMSLCISTCQDMVTSAPFYRKWAIVTTEHLTWQNPYGYIDWTDWMNMPQWF